ncbi:MAG: pilus (MSHA type) biogenesis protein MshL [Sulfurospirillum sp.]|nr:pilus (MSHA type) biogenesis protein MshL [Sulfurospirillum sp.]
MRIILNFLQNSTKVFATLCVILFFTPNAKAADLTSCEYKVFNIKTTQKVTSNELLTQLGDSCDFSIVIKDGVAGPILNKELQGINIKDLSLDDIFEILLSDNDLFYEYNKNILKITAIKTKTFRVDYITSIRQGTAVLNASLEGTTTGDTTSASSSTNTVTSNDSFDFWTTMSTELTSMLNTGSESYTALAPIINPNAGLITITGTKKQLDRVEEYLTSLKERLHKQVLIDVSILSVDLTKSKSTGINWSKFNLYLNSTAKFNNKSEYAADGSTHSITDSNDRSVINSGLVNAFTDYNQIAIVNDAVFSMAGMIDFLNTNGDTRVVSNPKVLTLNNQQALITIGDTINYKLITTTNGSDTGAQVAQDEEVKSIFVGVLLNITPQITDNGEIVLRINPSVSSLKYAEDNQKQTVTRTIAPDTSEKKLSTVVKVKNGNTIILGGLITNRNGVENSKVPLLGDIPLLGQAFRHSQDISSTQELVFVITPRIIGANDNTQVTLKELGYSKRVYEQ